MINNLSINKSSEGAPLLVNKRVYTNKEISNEIRKLEGFEYQANNIETCGTVEIYYRCGCGIIEIFRTCKYRICPHCSPRRSNTIHRTYFNPLKKHKIARSVFDSGLRLVTLTQRSKDSLLDGIISLHKYLKKLKERKYFKNFIFGGIGVIEVTKSNNKWHVHMHLIVDSRYLDMKHKPGEDSKFVKEWKKVTGGDCIVYVNRVYSHKGALNYVLKYITKTNSNLTLEDTSIYFKETFRKRLVFTFGSLYNIIEKIEKVCRVCHEKFSYIDSSHITELGWEYKIINPHKKGDP